MGRIQLDAEGERRPPEHRHRRPHDRALAGPALEQVDGELLEDVVVTDLTMRDVPYATLFFRLGVRLRPLGASRPGTVCCGTIDGLDARGVARDHVIFIAALPGHPFEDSTHAQEATNPGETRYPYAG